MKSLTKLYVIIGCFFFGASTTLFADAACGATDGSCPDAPKTDVNEAPKAPLPVVAEVHTMEAHTAEEATACSTPEEHKSTAESFELPEVSQRLLGVKLLTAKAGSAESVLRVPGEFILQANAAESISLPIEGFVTRRVSQGQTVKTGDIIATVNSLTYRTQQAIISSLKTRIENLTRQGISNAELTREATIAQASLPTVEVIDGQIILRASRNGVAICPSRPQGGFSVLGEEVAQVVDLSMLDFKADVQKQFLSKLPADLSGYVTDVLGQPLTASAHVRSGLVDDDGSSSFYLTSLPVKVTESSATLPPLRVGQPGVAVLLISQIKGNFISLPFSAVVDDGIHQVVFVQDEHDKNRFYKEPVDVKASAQGWITVSGHIHPGAQVVVEGAYSLKQAFGASTGSEKPALGHFHADGVFHEGEH